MKKQNIMTNDAIFSKQTLSHMCKKKPRKFSIKKYVKMKLKFGWFVFVS